MRHAHSGKIPFDCPFFSTAGHTLTGQSVMLGCSKILVQATVCPLARRKKGRMGFCYVRYSRGAGSLLASPTLPLVEGLCQLQAACAINQRKTPQCQTPKATIERHMCNAGSLLASPPLALPDGKNPHTPKTPLHKGGQEDSPHSLPAAFTGETIAFFCNHCEGRGMGRRERFLTLPLSRLTRFHTHQHWKLSGLCRYT